MYKNQVNADTARAVMEFFDWSFHNGQGMADELHYVPMPKSVIDMVENTWIQNIKSDGKAVWSAKMNIK